MLGTLMESRAPRPRRTGGTLVSVAVHGGVIALATALTAHATQRTAPHQAAASVVYLPPPATHRLPHVAAAPAAVPVPGRIALPPVPAIAIPEPTAVPAVDPAQLIPNWPDAHSGPPVYRYPEQWGPPGGGEAPANGVWSENMVDRAVEACPNNPAPTYPAMLRSANVDGAVEVQFVVDTAGRVEAGSIKVRSASHELFVRAVRTALDASCYRPAEAHGRRVRQLVQQRFTFALTR